MKKNKIINKFIKLVDRLINYITTLVFILILLFGVYALYDAYSVYDSGKLSDEILNLSPRDEDAEFSLRDLQKINKDICGWVKINDTHIDYPIVVGKDNSEYLNLDYKKEYSTAGSIFLDYRNDRDFKDDYTIIYGHNMHGNMMFGDIKKFRDKTFFDEHEFGTLYTLSGIYNIDILCIANVGAYDDRVYNLLLFRNGYVDSQVENYKNISEVKRNLNFDKDDKILVLSTCDVAGSNDRIVLVAKLTKKDASEIINEGNEGTLKRIENEKEAKNNNTTKTITQPVNTQQRQAKKFIRLSTRAIALIILTIIVIIIFSVLVVKKIKNSKGKHSSTKK